VVGMAVAVARTRSPAVDEEVRGLDALVLLNAVFTIGLAALPNVPKYGGVKLFLPFFPFLAILAGRTRMRLHEIGLLRIVAGLLLYAVMLLAHPLYTGHLVVIP